MQQKITHFCTSKSNEPLNDFEGVEDRIYLFRKGGTKFTSHGWFRFSHQFILSISTFFVNLGSKVRSTDIVYFHFVCGYKHFWIFHLFSNKKIYEKCINVKISENNFFQQNSSIFTAEDSTNFGVFYTTPQKDQEFF
jgi:hypothetical protein